MEEKSSNSIIKTNNFLEREKSYYSELTKERLILSGLVAGFLGVVYETLLMFFRTGEFQYKSGIVFFPFANPVYALGGILLTLVYYRFKTVGGRFLASFILTSVVEYLISFLQETFSGAVSWDYSDQLLNINGRITIIFSLFWGLLGILWCYLVYPNVLKIELKMSDKSKKAFKVFLLYALICCIITIFAYLRYSQRLAGSTDTNFLYTIIDTLFPDKLMNFFYSGLVVL